MFFFLSSLPVAAKSSNAASKKSIFLGSVNLQRAKFFDVPVAESTKRNEKDSQRNDDVENENEIKTEKTFRTIASQTIYREQSAQTRPYLPQAKIVQKTMASTVMPEVVLVSELLDGHTVPGQREIDLILNARKRRQWEKALFETNSRSASEKKRILEAFEWHNWLNREEDFELTQSQRLEIVKKIMDERQASLAEDAAERIDKSIERISSEQEKKVQRAR